MPRKNEAETLLLSGQTVYKDDERLEVCGTLDEISSLLGVVKTFLKGKNDELFDPLTEIQRHLFVLGAEISGLEAKREVPKLGEDALKFLEELEKKYDEKLPRLRNFIFPGGCKAAAFLHLARAVVRRGERKAIRLSRRFQVDPLVISYLNKLSKVLFILARYANFREGVAEDLWVRS